MPDAISALIVNELETLRKGTLDAFIVRFVVHEEWQIRKIR